MDEILGNLPCDSLVLDLGSQSGSFPVAASKARAIRVDLVVPRCKPEFFVQADAACLPFRSRTFDAIILNHSIEHFGRLKPSLQELGRVVKTSGAVFVAVPDATTATDRVYRKLFRNSGGHVNLFDSSERLQAMLSWYLGLPHVATRTLLSSWSYLNRRNIVDASSRSQMIFAGLWEPVVAALAAGTRLIDRWFGTRTSVYGWALYFGAIPERVDKGVLPNVCVRCGQAHPAALWAKTGTAKRFGFLTLCNCPGCGTRNILMRDPA